MREIIHFTDIEKANSLLPVKDETPGRREHYSSQIYITTLIITFFLTDHRFPDEGPHSSRVTLQILQNKILLLELKLFEA